MTFRLQWTDMICYPQLRYQCTPNQICVAMVCDALAVFCVATPLEPLLAFEELSLHAVYRDFAECTQFLCD